MPTYEYRCTKCSHEFEEYQTMTDEPLSKCPKCGGKPQRVISGGAGLLFKGDGFYITDNRSEGYKKDAKKEAPKSESSDSKGSSKDSKASTTPPKPSGSSGDA